jgi:hypothetical protein
MSTGLLFGVIEEDSKYTTTTIVHCMIRKLHPSKAFIFFLKYVFPGAFYFYSYSVLSKELFLWFWRWKPMLGKLVYYLLYPCPRELWMNRNRPYSIFRAESGGWHTGTLWWCYTVFPAPKLAALLLTGNRFLQYQVPTLVSSYGEWNHLQVSSAPEPAAFERQTSIRPWGEKESTLCTISPEKWVGGWVLVAHAYNLNNLRGWDWENCTLRHPGQIVRETSISKITRAKWTGGVAQLCKC